jgi:hypothetical protein
MNMQPVSKTTLSEKPRVCHPSPSLMQATLASVLAQIQIETYGGRRGGSPPQAQVMTAGQMAHLMEDGVDT